MPDTTIDLLFRFLEQNEGILSKRARSDEFEVLTEDEVARVESYFTGVSSFLSDSLPGGPIAHRNLAPGTR